MKISRGPTSEKNQGMELAELLSLCDNLQASGSIPHYFTSSADLLSQHVVTCVRVACKSHALRSYAVSHQLQAIERHHRIVRSKFNHCIRSHPTSQGEGMTCMFWESRRLEELAVFPTQAKSQTASACHRRPGLTQQIVCCLYSFCR